MKRLVVVCLGVLILFPAVTGSPRRPAPEDFALANRIGEPNTRSFFMFSTSAGKYIIRQDGMGEVTLTSRRRRVFNLKLGTKGRIERVYFLEHEGDLFLLYEVHDATSERAYLLRMEQKNRKPRWLTSLPITEVAPTIRDEFVVIKTIEIRKADGQVK